MLGGPSPSRIHHWQIKTTLWPQANAEFHPRSWFLSTDCNIALKSGFKMMNNCKNRSIRSSSLSVRAGQGEENWILTKLLPTMNSPFPWQPLSHCWENAAAISWCLCWKKSLLDGGDHHKEHSLLQYTLYFVHPVISFFFFLLWQFTCHIYMKEMTVDIITKTLWKKSYTIRPTSYKMASGPAYTQRVLTRL